MAPPVPPETGASMKAMPAASAALATFWLVAAAIVELSMMSAPLAIACSRPAWPSLRSVSAFLLNRSSDLQAVCGELVAGGFGEVKRADVVAGFLQVEGHGAAHVAEADECDLHGVVSWWG